MMLIVAWCIYLSVNHSPPPMPSFSSSPSIHTQHHHYYCCHCYCIVSSYNNNIHISRRAPTKLVGWNPMTKSWLLLSIYIIWCGVGGWMVSASDLSNMRSSCRQFEMRSSHHWHMSYHVSVRDYCHHLCGTFNRIVCDASAWWVTRFYNSRQEWRL